MKKDKIIYWVTTSIIFLWDGVMPAFTSHTPLAVEGIRHLGYPDYFRIMLTVFKVAGSIILILPYFKGRIKEWAYAGFTYNFVAAAVSTASIDGLGPNVLFPLVILVILVVSYLYYHKIYGVNAKNLPN
jgi:hypothetical protein